MTESMKLFLAGLGGIAATAGFFLLDCAGADEDKEVICAEHCMVADDGGIAPLPDAAPPLPPDARPPPSRPDAGLPIPPPTGQYRCDPGPGTDYAVGPENPNGPDPFPYTLDTVPWTELGPGDSVRLHWATTPYRRRILISTKGTAEQPILFCGVPGPEGQPPILDGANSEPAALAGYRQASHASLGMILFYASSQTEWNERPAFVTIQGLEIMNAHPSVSGWGAGSACIRVNDGGKNITIRGNVLHGCDNGVFSSSTSGGDQLNENMVIEANELYDNGSSRMSGRAHQMYVQGVRTRIIGNYVHSPRQGSVGTGIKDRSPGTVIAYNWVESRVIVLDLVEPQDHYDQVAGHPLYNTAWVYGNVLVYSSGGGRVIHFGGDVSVNYRKGPLYVYNNSIHIKPDANAWDNAFVDIDAADGIAYAHNNAVWREDSGRGIGITLIQEAGTLYLGVNAFGPLWREKKDPGWSGTAVGMDNILTTTTPGWDPATYEPIQDSGLTDEAGPYATGIEPPPLQYLLHRQVELRQSHTTLGALE